MKKLLFTVLTIMAITSCHYQERPMVVLSKEKTDAPYFRNYPYYTYKFWDVQAERTIFRNAYRFNEAPSVGDTVLVTKQYIFGGRRR